MTTADDEELPFCTMIGESGYGPVHWLEVVPGEPRRIGTACGKYRWESNTVLSPTRAMMQQVTCPECLTAMTNEPKQVTLGPDQPPSSLDEVMRECERLVINSVGYCHIISIQRYVSLLNNEAGFSIKVRMRKEVEPDEPTIVE